MPVPTCGMSPSRCVRICAPALVLAELRTFAPDDRPLPESELPEMPGSRSRLHPPRLGPLDRLVALLGDPPYADTEPLLVLRREQLVEIDQWLADAWKQCTLRRDPAPDRGRLQELHHLRTVAARLRRPGHRPEPPAGGHAHLDMRIGSVPSDNLARLRTCSDIQSPDPQRSRRRRDPAIRWPGRREDAAVLDSVLHAAAFQPLIIPESHDNPEAVARRTGQPARNWIANVSSCVVSWQTGLTPITGSFCAHDSCRQLEPRVSLRMARHARVAPRRHCRADCAAHLPDVEARLSESLSLPFVLERANHARTSVTWFRCGAETMRPVEPSPRAGAAVRCSTLGEFDPTILFAAHLRRHVRHDVW